MKRLGNPVAFGALVVAVVAAPFLFSDYRTYQLGFVGLYLCRQPFRGRGFGTALWRAALAGMGDPVVGLDAEPLGVVHHR